MHKRGFGYVDWTISMGLFIVVVLAIFIFLKPGAQPVYDHENLLDVVETNLLKDGRWSIIKVPLFIKRLDKQTIEENPRPLQAELTYAQILSVNIIEPPNNIVEVTHINSSVPPKIIFKCRNPLGPSCTDVTVTLLFAPTTTMYPNANINIICQPIGGSFCRLEPGASEFIEGLRESFFTVTQSYESVKENWNFPESKEFVIIINDEPLIQGQLPPAQANVFARSKKYWILKQNGQRIPIDINMRVW